MGVVYYAYPIFSHISFAYIAEEHIRELRKYMRVERVAYSTVPFLHPAHKIFLLLHPFYSIFFDFGDVARRALPKFEGVIGFEVADSNRISGFAVEHSNYARALIVPSRFSREAFVRSGVKVPIYVVPHGVRDEWIDAPKIEHGSLYALSEMKRKKNAKLLLSFIVHSPYRKGEDLLFKIFSELKKERKDVLLVYKGARAVKVYNEKMYVAYHGWLTNKQKMELFDLCDVYVLTSRGGGFEHPPLEAIARGMPAIGAKGGSWEDYMCNWMLVDSRESDVVLKGNPVHVGTGVEMVVEKAVDKLHEILDNLDEYRAKTREHVEKVIKREFTWRIIGEKLRDIVHEYNRTY